LRSVDDLTMYVYGLLEGPQERAIQEHLESCRACTEISERIGSEHRFLEGALAREIPESSTREKATDEVLARRYAPRPSVDWKMVYTRFRPAAGIGFMLGLFLLLFVLSSLPRPVGEKQIAAPPSPALMAAAEPAPQPPPPPAPAVTPGPGPGACDLKILMTWDARAAVDLEVQEPGDVHASMDHRNRFGLETYVVPRMKSGTYRVGARLRGAVRSKVKILVLLYEGTEFEERREETVTLEKSGETRFIRDIVTTR
jgi:anti-sigma factor RsiW